MIAGEAKPLFKNNSLEGNSATTSGGGIATTNTATGFLLESSIVWNNSAASAPQIDDPNSAITVLYSDVQTSGAPYPGTGNINADPQFVNVLNCDLHL